MYAFMVYLPPLPAKKDVQPTVPPPDAGGRQIPQAHPQGALVFGAASVAKQRPGDAHQTTGSALANLEAGDKMAHDLALLDRLQTFFARTS
jgi:hypothetical protein